MVGEAADYDVIIVGTRVAGSILGSLLGDMGHRVLALDRAHFPSDTLPTPNVEMIEGAKVNKLLGGNGRVVVPNRGERQA